MRVGRFARVAEIGADTEAPRSFWQLLVVDIVPALDQTDDRIALDRVRALGHSAAFLTMLHAVGGTLAVLGALKAGVNANSLFATFLFGALLLLDCGLWYITRRHRTWQLGASTVVRLAAGYCALAGILLLLVAEPAIRASGNDLLIRTALAGCFMLGIAAFLVIPALVLETYLLALVQLAMLGAHEQLIGAVAAFGGCLLWYSLVSARDATLSVSRRLTTEWQAQKAKRFVAEFEQSGRGWFWETNADGSLSYVSDQLAEDVKRPASELLGSQFTELVSVEDANSPEAIERTLGFHLSARFPFTDVTVRAKREEELWWTISGTPYFDDYGKFLGFRGIGSDLTEKRRSEAEISKLARYDSLTGLPNRSLMRQTLEQALKNAARRRQGCSLFLIDLDRFKNVNDTLGHPVGDALLKQVAQRLTTVIGEYGQVGRLGGDEFEAVFPGTAEEGLLGDLAKRLIQQVSMPYCIDGANVSIGASVGIALSPIYGACADALVRDADLALYAAKADGRGTHKFFRPEMHSDAKDRQILENDLRGAVERGEMAVFYQPVVNSITEDVVGFEALLRWSHPVRGSIPPSVFIPLAEECGAIIGLGEWVLRSACAEAAKWPSHVKVAVNLSPIQFSNPGMAALIVNALRSAQLEPERLELEITESVFLQSGESTDATFAQLKSIGVSLALDDFGTGYSSLGYLRKAPFDKIKIDQSFVRGAASPGNRNAAIIRSIVSLAESLGMDTTAEGAETHDELDLIRQLGCSQVQGYIFGRAMPAEQATQLALESKRVIADGHQFSRAPRHRLIRRATLHWGERAMEARLRNISSGGALIECERGIAPGTQVRLLLPGCGEIYADVRWASGGQLGLSFETEFDLRKLAPKARSDGSSLVRPDYLNSENSPDSPWAARQERLTAKEVRRF